MTFPQWSHSHFFPIGFVTFEVSISGTDSEHPTSNNINKTEQEQNRFRMVKLFFKQVIRVSHVQLTFFCLHNFRTIRRGRYCEPPYEIKRSTLHRAPQNRPCVKIEQRPLRKTGANSVPLTVNMFLFGFTSFTELEIYELGSWMPNLRHVVEYSDKKGPMAGRIADLNNARSPLS